MTVMVVEHRAWNLIIIDDNSDSKTVVTDEVEVKENKVAIPILPPGQLIEIIDYSGEEFILAGRGLKEGLEIERVQVDPAPEYEEAPEYTE